MVEHLHEAGTLGYGGNRAIGGQGPLHIKRSGVAQCLQLATSIFRDRTIERLGVAMATPGIFERKTFSKLHVPSSFIR